MEIAKFIKLCHIIRIATNTAAVARGTIHDGEFYIVASCLIDRIATEIVSCRTEKC